MDQSTKIPDQKPFFRSRWGKLGVIVMFVALLALIAVAIDSDLRLDQNVENPQSEAPAIMEGAPGLLTGFMGFGSGIMPGWEVPPQGEESRKAKPYDPSFGTFATNFEDLVTASGDPNLRGVVFILMLKDRHERHPQPCVSIHVVTSGMDRDQQVYHRILTEPTVPERLAKEVYVKVRDTLKTIQYGEKL